MQWGHEAFSQQSWFFLNEGENHECGTKKHGRGREKLMEEEIRARRKLPLL